MRVYIRHGEKEYKNGQNTVFSHDPSITHEGMRAATNIAKILLQTYGAPLYIVCSPYRRTRETAQYIRDSLPFYVPIYYDKELSEFLGNHSHRNLDVTPETGNLHPPHPERFFEFVQRVKSHDDQYQHFDTLNSATVWIITHGLFIKQLFRIKMGFELKHTPCLYHLSSHLWTKKNNK